MTEVLTHTWEQAVRDILSLTLLSDTHLQIMKTTNIIDFNNEVVKKKIADYCVANIDIPEDLMHELFLYRAQLLGNSRIRNIDKIREVFYKFLTKPYHQIAIAFMYIS